MYSSSRCAAWLVIPAKFTRYPDGTYACDAKNHLSEKGAENIGLLCGTFTFRRKKGCRSTSTCAEMQAGLAAVALTVQQTIKRFPRSVAEASWPMNDRSAILTSPSPQQRCYPNPLHFLCQHQRRQDGGRLAQDSRPLPVVSLFSRAACRTAVQPILNPSTMILALQQRALNNSAPVDISSQISQRQRVTEGGKVKSQKLGFK